MVSEGYPLKDAIALHSPLGKTLPPSQRALSGADNSPSRNEGHALAGRLPVEAALDAVSGFAPDAMPDAARDDIDDMTDALLDARTRPEHAAWHGVILPVDHPWWKRHYPPNGWKCRCKAMSVGPDDLEAEGWTVADAAGRGDFRPTGARRVVGCLDDAVLAFLEGMGSAPASAAVTIGDADLLHALRSSKVEPLPVAVWARLPSLLATPAGIYWDLRKPGLVYVLDEPEGKGKMIVLVDYATRMERTRVVVNSVRTGRRIENLEEFENEKWYMKVR